MISAGAKIDRAPQLARFVWEVGGTPLTEAIRHRKTDIIEMLITRGANLDFHLAYTYHRRRMCRQFCQTGTSTIWDCLHDPGEDVMRFLFMSGGRPENCQLYPFNQVLYTQDELMKEVAELVPEIKDDSLQNRCREKVRHQLRRFSARQPLYRSIKKLGLPQRMQKYLLFNVNVWKFVLN